MTVLLHMTPEQNVPKILEAGLEARRGARSREAEEQDKAVFLFKTLDAAETALGGWFGESFDEQTQLSLLAVDLTIDIPDDPLTFEVAISADIPAAAITLICEDLDQIRSFEALRAQVQAVGPTLDAREDEDLTP